MQHEYLFSYGTLQKKEVQLGLFGRILVVSDDILIGFKVSAIEIKDERFLSRGQEKYQKTLVVADGKNDLVKGTALEMTIEELLLADKYEPSNYKRIKVTLESGKNAWVYVAMEEK